MNANEKKNIENLYLKSTLQKHLENYGMFQEKSVDLWMSLIKDTLLMKLKKLLMNFIK